MSFWVQNLLKICLLPPAGLFLLIALGLLLRRRRPRLALALAGSGLSALLFMSSGLGAWALVHPLESLEAPLDPRRLAEGQAIVVLAAGRHRAAPEFAGEDVADYIGMARVVYAGALQRRSGLPVLVSGGAPGGLHSAPLAKGLALLLGESMGVPVRWQETRSRNTDENARFSAELLRRDGVHAVLLVTDAMHMRRARLAFEAAGLTVIAAPTVFLEHSPFRLAYLLPTAENLRRSSYAVYEWIGLCTQAISRTF